MASIKSLKSVRIHCPIQKHSLFLAWLERYDRRSRWLHSNGVIDRRLEILTLLFLAPGRNDPCKAWGHHDSGSDHRRHNSRDSEERFQKPLGEYSAIDSESLADGQGFSSCLRNPDGVDRRRLHLGYSLPLGLRFLALRASPLTQLILGLSSLSLVNLLCGKDCLKMGDESYFGCSLVVKDITAQKRLETAQQEILALNQQLQTENLRMTAEVRYVASDAAVNLAQNRRIRSC